MRLFLALELPNRVKEDIARRVQRLRGDFPKARWVRPQAMHLTLSFLGERDSAVLETLERALGPAFASQNLFDCRLGAPGTFPPKGRTRVLWIGVENPEPIVILHRRVTQALHQALGGEAPPDDGRPFRPHVTLARCSPNWPRLQRERFLEAWDESPFPSFAVDRGVLFESELHPSGARYHVRQTHALAQGPTP